MNPGFKWLKKQTVTLVITGTADSGHPGPWDLPAARDPHKDAASGEISPRRSPPGAARSSLARRVAGARPLPSFSSAHFIREKYKFKEERNVCGASLPRPRPSLPALRLPLARPPCSSLQVAPMAGLDTAIGPGPAQVGGESVCSSPAAARPPSPRRRCSLNAREPLPRSQPPLPLARPRSSPARGPSPRLRFPVPLPLVRLPLFLPRFLS